MVLATTSSLRMTASITETLGRRLWMLLVVKLDGSFRGRGWKVDVREAKREEIETPAGCIFDIFETEVASWIMTFTWNHFDVSGCFKHIHPAHVQLFYVKHVIITYVSTCAFIHIMYVHAWNQGSLQAETRTMTIRTNCSLHMFLVSSPQGKPRADPCKVHPELNDTKIRFEDCHYFENIHIILHIYSLNVAHLYNATQEQSCHPLCI